MISRQGQHGNLSPPPSLFPVKKNVFDAASMPLEVELDEQANHGHE
jgi:hypothetical protein